MKKLMFAAAVIAAGVAVADIVSANCVGYEQYKTKDTFNWGMVDILTPVGIPMGKVGGGDFVCGTAFFDHDVESSDQVVNYNPVTMDYENFTFSGYSKDGDSLGWTHLWVDENFEEHFDGDIASFNLSKGQEAFYHDDAYMGVTVTVAGEVADLNEPQTWTMPEGVYCWPIMNPYPIDTTFADIETFAQSSDAIYIVNPAYNDVDIYTFNGPGEGWYVMKYNENFEQEEYTETDSSKVILNAGFAGYFVNWNMDGRSWTVSLQK